MTAVTTNRSRLRAPLMALGMLLFAGAAAAMLGPRALSPGELLAALRGQGSPLLHTLVWTFRLPRVAGAALAGALLGLAGAMLQRSTRNLLADPGLLGLNAGAHLALLILLLRATTALAANHWRAPVAFAGAGLAALLVWTLASHRGERHPRRFLLIGIAVEALIHALGLVLTFTAPIDVFTRALVWSAGNLGSLRWADDALLAGALVLLLPIAWLSSGALDALALGDESAALLGVRVARTRLIAVLVAVISAGLCTAVGAGIAFVGLLAPNLALRLTGPRTRPLLFVAVLSGALFLLVADTLGRTLLGAAELPAGILVAAVGAPYFLWLLVTR